MKFILNHFNLRLKIEYQYAEFKLDQKTLQSSFITVTLFSLF